MEKPGEKGNWSRKVTKNTIVTLSVPPKGQPSMQLKPLKGAASGELFGCPWVTQPEARLESDWTSLEACENGCGPTFAIQPDGAWKVVQSGRNCLNTRVPWFWLHIQKDLRCINKEFSRRLWIFAVMWFFFMFWFLNHLQQENVIQFIMEYCCNIKCEKKWSVVNTFWLHCIRVQRLWLWVKEV